MTGVTEAVRPMRGGAHPAVQVPGRTLAKGPAAPRIRQAAIPVSTTA